MRSVTTHPRHLLILPLLIALAACELGPLEGGDRELGPAYAESQGCYEVWVAGRFHARYPKWDGFPFENPDGVSHFAAHLLDAEGNFVRTWAFDDTRTAWNLGLEEDPATGLAYHDVPAQKLSNRYIDTICPEGGHTLVVDGALYDDDGLTWSGEPNRELGALARLEFPGGVPTTGEWLWANRTERSSADVYVLFVER